MFFWYLNSFLHLLYGFPFQYQKEKQPTAIHDLLTQRIYWQPQLLLPVFFLVLKLGILIIKITVSASEWWREWNPVVHQGDNLQKQVVNSSANLFIYCAIGARYQITDWSLFIPRLYHLEFRFRAQCWKHFLCRGDGAACQCTQTSAEVISGVRFLWNDSRSWNVVPLTKISFLLASYPLHYIAGSLSQLWTCSSGDIWHHLS